jgi:hypothetical protein
MVMIIIIIIMMMIIIIIIILIKHCVVGITRFNSLLERNDLLSIAISVY